MRPAAGQTRVKSAHYAIKQVQAATASQIISPAGCPMRQLTDFFPSCFRYDNHAT